MESTCFFSASFRGYYLFTSAVRFYSRLTYGSVISAMRPTLYRYDIIVPVVLNITIVRTIPRLSATTTPYVFSSRFVRKKLKSNNHLRGVSYHYECVMCAVTVVSRPDNDGIIRWRMRGCRLSACCCVTTKPSTPIAPMACT